MARKYLLTGSNILIRVRKTPYPEGLYGNDTESTPPLEGEVLATGPHATDDAFWTANGGGDRLGGYIRRGQIVIAKRGAGQPPGREYGDDKGLLILHASDILAVVEEG